MNRWRWPNAHLTIIQTLNNRRKLTDIRDMGMTKAKAERAAVLEEDIKATIESAEECPGECIYIEAQ